jgi:hypothetical protein
MVKNVAMYTVLYASLYNAEFIPFRFTPRRGIPGLK